MPHRRSVNVGDRSGMIVAVAIKKSPASGKHCRVIIQCDCGTESEMATQIFKKSKSCGCQRRNSSTWKQIGPKIMPWRLPEGESSRRGFVYFARVSAKKRGLDFSISDEDVIAIASSSCVYCGSPPTREFKQNPSSHGAFVCNGIDRVDNGKGYIAGNVVACCKPCNMMKHTMSREDFLSHVQRIVQHQSERRDASPHASGACPVICQAWEAARS